MTTIACVMFALWIIAFSIHLSGAGACRRHFDQQPISPDTPFRLIPISILKPLKGVDPGLEENLRSFLALDYPEYEILFSVADGRDPAAEVVRRILRENPGARARLIVGETVVGRNPKINNLIRSYSEAAHPWILISDSNIRVRPDYLKRLASQIGSDTGMITSVVLGAGESDLGGALEAVHLNTFYAKAMVLAAKLGRDCVVGKSMLFRKSAAERFGGLRALGGFLAEDYMAGEAMKQLGLRVSTAWDAVPQYIGRYSVEDYWSRHVRWGRIRKAQNPAAFLLELLGSALVPGLLAASAAAIHGYDGVLVLIAHLLAWATLDFLILQSVGAKPRALTAISWLLRELSAPLLWLHIASGNSVHWRGARYRLSWGGLLVEQKARV